MPYFTGSFIGQRATNFIIIEFYEFHRDAIPQTRVQPVKAVAMNPRNHENSHVRFSNSSPDSDRSICVHGFTLNQAHHRIGRDLIVCSASVPTAGARIANSGMLPTQRMCKEQPKLHQNRVLYGIPGQTLDATRAANSHPA